MPQHPGGKDRRRAGRKPPVPFCIAIAPEPTPELTFAERSARKERVPQLSARAIVEARKRREEAEEQQLNDERARAQGASLPSAGAATSSGSFLPPIAPHYANMDALRRFQLETDRALLAADLAEFEVNRDPSFLPVYYDSLGDPAHRSAHGAAAALRSSDGSWRPLKLPSRPQLFLSSDSPRDVSRAMVLRSSNDGGQRSGRRRNNEAAESSEAQKSDAAAGGGGSAAVSDGSALQPHPPPRNASTTASGGGSESDEVPWWRRRTPDDAAPLSSGLIERCERLDASRRRVLRAFDDVAYQAYCHFLERPTELFDFYVEEGAVEDCGGVDVVAEIMSRTKYVITVQGEASPGVDAEDRHFGIEPRHAHVLRRVAAALEAAVRAHFSVLEDELKEDAAVERQR